MLSCLASWNIHYWPRELVHESKARMQWYEVQKINGMRQRQESHSQPTTSLSSTTRGVVALAIMVALPQNFLAGHVGYTACRNARDAGAGAVELASSHGSHSTHSAQRILHAGHSRLKSQCPMTHHISPADRLCLFGRQMLSPENEGLVSVDAICSRAKRCPCFDHSPFSARRGR